MTTPTVQRRALDTASVQLLKAAQPELTDLEAQLLASRGAVPQIQTLPQLLGRSLMDLEKGAARIVRAILGRERIVVVADYDCDGATACTVAVAGLRALGANIGYVVPDRMVHGYGISPSVVDLARDRFKDATVLITVDNGILGHTGITYAASKGMDVVVTDHHLPGDTLPSDAAAVIDPSRVDCESGLEKIAGVSVALWLVVEVKRQLSAKGINTPTLTFLLPYVAIGTVADMVPLDAANRLLVAIGLDRMRRGDVPPGVKALLAETGAISNYLTTLDIGFGVGPRINAAGRLETMDAGIELLLSQDPKHAKKLAQTLSATNEERKRLQKEATDDASAATAVEGLDAGETMTIVKGSRDWHPGIVGLVASRLKDKHFRPTFIFSVTDEYAKGSGRSIPGFHLKDALEEVARRAPGLLKQFGGHAMAAGATLTSPEALEPFARAFDEVAAERITPQMLNSTLMSDGPMPDMSLEMAARVLRHPWGQGFEAPAFDDIAVIDSVKALGQSGQHWRVEARVGGRTNKTTVVLFNQPEPQVNQEVRLFLRPGLNTWLSRTNLQWLGSML